MPKLNNQCSALAGAEIRLIVDERLIEHDATSVSHSLLYTVHGNNALSTRN